MFHSPGRAPSSELLADLVDGAKKMRADGAGAEAEVLGDLLERELLVVTEPEDDFLLRGEASLRPLNRSAELHRHELTFCVRPLIHRLEQRTALLAVFRREAEKADHASPSQSVAGEVDGDPRQPRLQLRAPFEAAETGVRLDERVLRDRVG